MFRRNLNYTRGFGVASATTATREQQTDATGVSSTTGNADDASSSNNNNNINNYEIVEEEVLETLSDDGIDDLRLFSQGLVGLAAARDDEEEEEDEECSYVEEEVMEARLLPGISEEGDEDGEEVEVEVDDDDDDEDYIEEEVMSNSHISFNSMTEVEVGHDSALLREVTNDDLDETLFEEEMDDDDECEFLREAIAQEEEEVEYVDDTIREEEDSEVEEYTIREEDDELLNEQEEFNRSCRIRKVSDGNKDPAPPSSSPYKDYETSPEDDDDDDSSNDDDDDGVSAEELTEAIEYVLKQEKAVQKFILTDEQAEKMAHLPVNVMKVIVDHLEACDNDASTPIDWDFLLKIVLPFCDSEKAANDDDDSEDADDDHGNGCPCAM